MTGNRSSKSVALPAAVATAAALVSAPASAVAADEAPEPIRLAYRASMGCPQEAEFVSRLRVRTARARPAWPGETARTFTIAVDVGPPSSGRIDIDAIDGERTTRSVRADTCSQVADALAMVVALAVDPRSHASTEASSAAPIAAPVEDPAPTSPAPSVEMAVTATRPSAERVPVPSSPPAFAEESSRRTTEGPASDGGRFFAGLSFVAATGVAPGTVLGGSPHVGWRARRAGWFDPSIRVAFVRAGSGPFDVSTGGKASFTWTVGQADACPVATPGARVRVTGCARVEAGALDAAGSDIPGGQTRTRPWLSVGPLVRAEWSAIPPVFVGAEAGLLVRVTSDRFLFLPDATVYQVPIVGVDAGVGLGVRFL